MAKDPAFLFYPQDFLTGTTFFNNTQKGIYITLLCAQHQMGGIIDKKSFLGIVGEDDLIKGKFTECEHGFYNERLIKEMDLRSKKSTNISNAMKEVWEKRKKKLIESYKDSNTILSKTDRKLIAIENENEDEDVIVNKDISIYKYDDLKNLLEGSYQTQELIIKARAWTETEYNLALTDFLSQQEISMEFAGKTPKEIYGHFSNWCRAHKDKFRPAKKETPKANSAGAMMEQLERIRKAREGK